MTSGAMPLREITLETSSRTIVLDSDAAMDFLAQIRKAAGDHREDAERPLREAIEGQRAHAVNWTEDGKRGALHALDAWVLSEGTGAMPDAVMDPARELMRDLGLPPFDEEIPYDPT